MGHSLICQAIQRRDRRVLRIGNEVAVNLQRNGRVAVSHILTYRLDRDVLRQKKAAIGMPQPVAGHVLHPPFALVESQPLPDGLRIERLPIDVDGEVVFIQAVVELMVGEPEPECRGRTSLSSAPFRSSRTAWNTACCA